MIVFMLRKIFIGCLVGLLAVFSLISQGTISASPLYGNIDDYALPALNDDPNFPFVYVYHAQREYIDLSSITVTNRQGKLTEFAVCYIITNAYNESNPIIKQGVLKFRYISGGTYRPQFWSEKHQNWLTIPKYEYNRINSLDYATYLPQYHPYEYYAFKMVYQRLFNAEFQDELHGHII